MPHKFHAQPFCKSCGKPLRKWTSTVMCREAPSKYDGTSCGFRYVYGTLHTKADCERVSNEKVVSVSRGRVVKTDTGAAAVEQTIGQFTTWDGESYTDKHFCTNTCAIRFANRCAELGMETKAHSEAIARRNAK